MEDLPELPPSDMQIVVQPLPGRAPVVSFACPPWILAGLKQGPVYTADQMREYARKAVLAERERIAKWYDDEGWLLDESHLSAAIRAGVSN